MGKRLTVARRELASLKSEKTIVLAIAIQLLVAGFSSFLVVGLVSLYDPGSVSGEFVVEFALSGDSEDLQRLLDANDGWRGVQYRSQDDAMDAFRRGAAHAAFHVDRQTDGSVEVTAVAPDGNVRTTLVVTQIKEVLSLYERTERAQLRDRLDRQPIRPPREASASPYYGFTYTVLVPLLVFLPVFISGSVAVDAISEEFERGTLELLRVTPLTDLDIVDGKTLAMGVLAPVQAAAWLALLSANGTSIANPVEILLLVVGFSVVVVTMGALLALAFRDRKQAQFLYSMGVLVLFSATYLLPESPANTVAKLAIGSPTLATHAMVAVSLVGGVALYAAARRVVARRGLA